MAKQRTISNLKPTRQSRARWLWEEISGDLEFSNESLFCQYRDEYHAMFKDSRNFIAGVEEAAIQRALA